MHIYPTPQFVRMFDSCETDIQERAIERIEMFRDVSLHKNLKVHKLHGKYKNCYGFSVTHRIRIVFQYSKDSKSEVYLLAIGDHTVYD